MEPEVLYAQCMPGEDPLRGDQAFVIAVSLSYRASYDVDPSISSEEHHVMLFPPPSVCLA